MIIKVKEQFLCFNLNVSLTPARTCRIHDITANLEPIRVQYETDTVWCGNLQPAGHKQETSCVQQLNFRHEKYLQIQRFYKMNK